MALEYDTHSGLPPIKPAKEVAPPPITVKEIVAVEAVRLAMGRAHPRVLKEFYGKVMGLKFEGGDETGMRFSFDTRPVVLLRDWPPADLATQPRQPDQDGTLDALGQLFLSVAHFKRAVQELGRLKIEYELLHGTSMARQAILRDPAGNVVWLLERREF